MQSVSARIWTRVAVSISYYDKYYTKGTSIYYLVLLICFHALNYFKYNNLI